MMADPGIILFGKKITSFPETAGESHGGSGSLMDGGDKDKQEDESRDNPKTPSINESEEPQTTGTENNTVDLQPKSLKKPDKILPCPRCESMNTKFCYYNNSNVNQPRHFCKSCQRYWTAGGTMRSMPVGAGRRKKKILPSHCRYIISQEASKSVVAPEVLSFGPNSPNLSVVSTTGREDSNPVVEKTQDFNRIPSQVHWISYNNPWNPAIPMPIPAICPPGYPPMQIYPSPYWNSVPWLPSVTHPPNLSILGKHSTDGEADEEMKKQKNSVLIPKTLRIDDPDEAAKSSIWATLGIKNENISRGDLFKAFQEKGDEKKKHPVTEPSSVLQANPAAFSRSLCFQERA